MINVKKHLQLLGLRVRDNITGFQGVVSSISFDLYGCIQAVVTPGLGEDGKLAEAVWFDVSRLKVLDKKPVMQLPDYDYGPQAEGRQGAAKKPLQTKWKMAGTIRPNVSGTIRPMSGIPGYNKLPQHMMR
jgi:hypothetical protein